MKWITNILCRHYITDSSNAFDRVDIPMLLFKLDKIGIDSNLLAWLESYLTNRTQCVKFEGFISRLINVSSGVPQGSHIGPLLFILRLRRFEPFCHWGLGFQIRPVFEKYCRIGCTITKYKRVLLNRWNNITKC